MQLSAVRGIYHLISINKYYSEVNYYSRVEILKGINTFADL